MIAALVAFRPGTSSNPIERGRPAPAFAGTTLDGERLALADLRGRPVVVNFWGPSCVPCRDEFPLFVSMLAEHGGEGLAIVGILKDDPPSTARDFIRDYGATWPTVEDPDEAIETAYRALARPFTIFIDRDGVIRELQIGEITEAEFEAKFATISGAGAGSTP
ncbi:MAG TPA: TlpA disulfide reductase family protein [Candidatus Limnocylindrales bacterium]|nr:TlpA disulfide reductase family protein [Candidatus Limnocylindrales bacterium]